MSGYHVKRLGPGEREGFHAMNALFASVFAMPREYLAATPDEDYVRRWLEDRRNIAIVAEAGGDVVGALAGYELAKFEQARSEIFLYDLAVAEPWRRRGIATAMIEEARAIARQCGAWTIFVQADIVPEDEPARRLYRKLACEEITALHFDIAP